MSGQVLAAIDLMDEAHHAPILGRAWQMAQLDDVPLAVMTVVPDFGMSSVGTFFPADTAQKAMERSTQLLHEIVARALPEANPDRISRIIRQGSIYQEILETAQAIRPGLIVMGAHRPALRDYLLGPNAARVLRHADCSVLVLRDPS
ncbi:Nucleotide-binding universal stress protein, UspA family [Paracoccus pantotrophus]|nr:Nucleotide-binding universal stress protein, UspA family [Paracoccus pantotrophus]